ncbi:LpqB family beta-propeller domain-containing protein [Enemella sp. A6]|uniref:LpqB family beta-propeller domain-containing protein n=1 Tax=Enemella sp. A6 TaxID=3440152 RepID=UPI003EBD8758
MFAVLLMLIGLIGTGCISVPTSGPVVPGGTPGPAEPENVEIAPEPPAPGASPTTIVEGYLHAMASYRGGYDVARQYLTGRASAEWRPEAGVQIYADGYPIVATEETVRLRAPKIGSVAADGGYRTSSDSIDVDFGLVQVDGEWRIDTPPQGLLIPEYLFKRFHQRVDLYFFDPSYNTLVPDPIYLPTGSPTTSVIRRLLAGPTKWLSPVVVTAIPNGTELNVAAPVDESGVVEVSLSESIGRLDENGRSRLAAQITWTLGQLSPNITGVRILNSGQAFAIREQNEDGVVPIDAYQVLDPIPRGQRADLYGSDDVGVGRVTETDGQARLEPVTGPAGSIGHLDTMGVSLLGDYVAMVSDDGTVLRSAPLAEGEVTTLLTGVSGLGRPQYTRFNELWVLAEVEGQQHVVVFVDGEQQLVDISKLGYVKRIRISPDGLRAAVVRQANNGGDELLIGRITRTDRVLLDGWQTLPFTVTKSQVQIADVGWTNPTMMMVLVAEGTDVPAKPYTLDQAGATWQLVGQPDNWNAVALATSPRGAEPRVMMLASDGTVWRFEEQFRWPRMLEGLSAIAYPG